MRSARMLQYIYILSASTGYRTVIHCYISPSIRTLPNDAAGHQKRFPTAARLRTHQVVSQISFPQMALPSPHCQFAGSILHTYVYTYLTSNNKWDRLSCCCLGFFPLGPSTKKSPRIHYLSKCSLARYIHKKREMDVESNFFVFQVVGKV